MRALIILGDDLYSLFQKGEIAKNYYNPQNIFHEVLVISPAPSVKNRLALKTAFGRAKYSLLTGILNRNLGLILSLGYQPRLLGLWFLPHLSRIRKFRPEIIRCYGHGFALSLGTSLKRILQIPLVCSLHGDPDRDYNRGRLGIQSPLRRLIGRLQLAAERKCWPTADHVIGVYDSIKPFLKRTVKNRSSIVRHAVVQGKIKKNYRIREGEKILYVGRIDRMEKDPTTILRAVEKNPTWRLDIIGNGNNLESLRRLVTEQNLSSRVTIRPSLPNRKLINTLHRYDWMAGHSLHEGVSKAWIEAALVGLPLVLNLQPKRNNREFWSLPALRVDDTPEGYFQAFQKLSQSIRLRQRQAKLAKRHAQQAYGRIRGARSIRSVIQSLTKLRTPPS